MRRKRRWGDNDRHFGPFTFAFRERYRPFAMILISGSSGDDEGGCHVRLQAFGATLICELPPLIKPWRRKVTARYWSAADIERIGRDWYWEEHPREFGFSLAEGFFMVKYGAQTMDSSTDENWGYFLPWTQWRQVEYYAQGADGKTTFNLATLRWDTQRTFIDVLQRSSFRFADHDGEIITASTYIQMRTWRLGTGWFKWLGFLWPRRRSRWLDLAFSSEVGREKGSFKGGVVGHSIEMLPGESAEQAFRRYCQKEHRSKSGRYSLQYIGAEATP